jgi:hypothetical protein
MSGEPLTPEQRTDARRLAAEVIARGASPEQGPIMVLSKGGIGVSFDWLHVLLARAVIDASREQGREAMINARHATEGHCRVPDMRLTGAAVKAIAQGYYGYRTDHPGRLSCGGTILTPTVDEVMQTLARALETLAEMGMPIRLPGDRS